MKPARRTQRKAGAIPVRSAPARIASNPPRYEPDDGPLTAAEFEWLAKTVKDDLPKGALISKKQLF